MRSNNLISLLLGSILTLSVSTSVFADTLLGAGGSTDPLDYFI